jgi:disulfide bond formation protein DsbB
MDVTTVSTFFALLTVAANVFVVGTLGLFLASRVSARARRVAVDAREWIRPAALPFAWIVALVATSGSLYYSEVAHFIPCRLCWYQRIGMYPLVLILGIAVYRRYSAIRRFVIPVVAAASMISIYHYQLERFPDQSSPACTAEAPCTFVWVWHFHYISIPFMALSAFALIGVLLALAGGRRAGEPAIPHDDALDLEEAFR